MKVQNKVSIVIPVYNVEHYVSRCLDSVLKQTYTNIEIICVDDCGTDNSMQLVEGYAKNYPEKIVLVRNSKNLGLGGARDAGIKASTGEFLAFIDSDDYIESMYIEKYVTAMVDYDADMVVGGFIRNMGDSFKKVMPGKTKEDLWLFCTACSKLYRKSFLMVNNINFRGVRRYEDELFSYRVLLNNAKTRVIDYTGYYYFLNSESITQNKKYDRTNIFAEYVENLDLFYREVQDQIQAENQEIFIYCLRARLIACLLFNARGCGTKRMRELYQIFDREMEKIEKRKRGNSYISIKKRITVEDIKVHYATWLVTIFRKVRLDKYLFMFDCFL